MKSKIDQAALSRLLEVLGGDVEDLEDLRNDYVEDAPEIASRISEAAASKDWIALRIAAHTLKSNARDFGAVRLAELCAELETACAAGGSAIPQEMAERVQREEEAARRALADLKLGDLKQPRPDR